MTLEQAMDILKDLIMEERINLTLFGNHEICVEKLSKPQLEAIAIYIRESQKEKE